MGSGAAVVGVGVMMLLMGVHHFFWFVWEGVVVELAGR